VSIEAFPCVTALTRLVASNTRATRHAQPLRCVTRMASGLWHSSEPHDRRPELTPRCRVVELKLQTMPQDRIIRPAVPLRRALMRRAALYIGLLAASACAPSDGSVTISGDVAGLDTLALRGDSLFLQAERRPQLFDSLRIEAKERLSRPSTVPVSAPTATVSSDQGRVLTGVEAMTARARARGDSMAKSDVARLTGVATGNRSRADTVRGIVTLVGAAPAQQVVLRTDNGANTVALSGMATSGLSKLAGMELVIRGIKVTPRDVVVSDYIVRGADGVPAYDGRLSSGAEGHYLQLTDGSGRKRIASLPSALRGLDGVRVWIAMAPGASSVHRYGLVTRY